MTEDSKPGAESPPDDQTPAHLAVGRVLRPHGIRGALLVQANSQLIHSLQAGTKVFLGSDLEAATVDALRPHRQRFLLFLVGCRDRDEAERWRGQLIYLSTADAQPLPPGVYYQWQILGLRVETENGEILGTIEEIIETGANDVYVVRDQSGKELLIPAIEHVVAEVDLEAGQMLVRLPPGLA